MGNGSFLSVVRAGVRGAADEEDALKPGAVRIHVVMIAASLGDHERPRLAGKCILRKTSATG
jgi:hypothetical protein